MLQSLFYEKAFLNAVLVSIQQVCTATHDIQVPVWCHRPVSNCVWALAFLLLGVSQASQASNERSILLQAPWAIQLGWDRKTTSPCVWAGLSCGVDGTLSSV